METNFIIGQIIGIFSAVIHSNAFLILKFIIGVYVLVLFADLILLLTLRDIGANIRVGLTGTKMPATSNKILGKLSSIKAKIASGETSQRKAAILELDGLISDVLRKMGYAGANMGEMLEKANEAQIENIEDLRRVHAISNKIVYELNYEISVEEANEAFEVYEKFLKDFEII